MNRYPSLLTNPSRRFSAFVVFVALAATAVPSFAQATAPSAKPALAPKSARTEAAGPVSAVPQKYSTNVKGPANAPIRVVEFADFMCPGCQQASIALRGDFAQQGNDINLTFKNFPLEQTCNPGIGRIATEYVREQGGTPEATVIGGGFKTSAANAAFANGCMAHALGFARDEMHGEVAHVVNDAPLRVCALCDVTQNVERIINR